MSNRNQGYARPEMLVETEWLEEHLGDQNIRIVDCDFPDAYRRAHIPGSVATVDDRYFKDLPDNPWHIVGGERFAEEMSRRGIGNDTLVICYDGFGGLYATRLWWALNFYGHAKAKVLNGGWNKWLLEGRPASIKDSRYPSAKFTPKQNDEFIATANRVVEAIGDSNTVVLDVRSDAEWTGENKRGTKRGGHIPGAVHLEWLNYVTTDDAKTFKPAAELHDMFQKRGVTPDKNIITY